MTKALMTKDRAEREPPRYGDAGLLDGGARQLCNPMSGVQLSILLSMPLWAIIALIVYAVT